MLFRQLFDARSSTYTYLLADEDARKAVLIDPVFEEWPRDAALLRELGFKLSFTLETHVHADHVTAAWLHRERLGSQIIVPADSSVQGADGVVADGDRVRFGGITIRAISTPGHTSSCMSYLVEDHDMVFTGDALLIRSAGRTDFQGGDAHRLYHSVRDRLFALPDTCLVFPAHDYRGRTMSTVGEEKRWNPRLGGERSEADFAGTMANLGLPHPKQLDVALPANLRCGRPPTGSDPGDATWGPATRTYAGHLEIEPEFVSENLAKLSILDVREPDEFTGELGHIPGAELVPLGELRVRLPSLAKFRPVVTVCRSGGRSAQAAVILEGAGFDRVANLAGGMLRWRALDLPTKPA